MMTPMRTSTYERPFTQEGNYLIFIVKAHTIKWQIYPDDVFYAKDLLPREGNYLVVMFSAAP